MTNHGQLAVDILWMSLDNVAYQRVLWEPHIVNGPFAVTSETQTCRDKTFSKWNSESKKQEGWRIKYELQQLILSRK